MQEDIHHIKTFELNTDWRSIRKYWYALLRGKCDLFEARKEFLRSYLPLALGRELNINETRGVKCVRVFYDENDEILSITIYDKAGYIDYEMNLEVKGKVSDRTADDDAEELKNLLENVRHVDELYDAKKAVLQVSPDTEDIVIYAEQCAWHFKKISVSRHDVYMQDPVWLYYNIFGLERRFYDLGYKLVGVTETESDGIITRLNRFYYDSEGTLLKRIFMCGTPWGGIVDYDEEHWAYDCEKNMVTRKDINIHRNFVRHLFQYKLDKQDRIRQRKDFGFPSNERAIENLVHTRTLHYSYGQNGKLCEIKPVFCVPTMKFERIVYEYDEQGRLILERSYDVNNELVSEETYRYISDKKVEVTYSLFMFS